MIDFDKVTGEESQTYNFADLKKIQNKQIHSYAVVVKNLFGNENRHDEVKKIG